MIGQQQTGNHQRADQQHQTLDHIRPDHRRNATDQRIDRHCNAAGNNDHRHTPTRERAQSQRDAEQDRAHSRQLR